MFMPLNGLLRLFLTGFPSGVVFLGPWATRADKSMRAGPRFWKLATPRVCRHGVRRVLERACASQKGHADDVRRSMIKVQNCCIIVARPRPSLSHVVNFLPFCFGQEALDSAELP
jgi:hypothetical protein